MFIFSKQPRSQKLWLMQKWTFKQWYVLCLITTFKDQICYKQTYKRGAYASQTGGCCKQFFLRAEQNPGQSLGNSFSSGYGEDEGRQNTALSSQFCLHFSKQKVSIFADSAQVLLFACPLTRPFQKRQPRISLHTGSSMYYFFLLQLVSHSHSEFLWYIVLFQCNQWVVLKRHIQIIAVQH